MTDDDGRERGEHSGADGRPREPERQIGGSDWLLQQLSGGRLKSIFDAPRPAPVRPEPSVPEDDSGTAATPADGRGAETAETDSAAETDVPSDVAADPEASSGGSVADDSVAAAPSQPSSARPTEEASPAEPPRSSTLGRWPAAPITVDPEAARPRGSREARAAAAPVGDVASSSEPDEPVDASAAEQPVELAPDPRSGGAASTAVPTADPITEPSDQEQPAASRSEPEEPEPSAPTPSAPTPSAPTPSDPTPSEPEPSDPALSESPTSDPLARVDDEESGESRAASSPVVAPDAPRSPRAASPVVAEPPATRPPLAAAEPPADLPSAPSGLRAAQERPRGDRPEGATPPSPREPEPEPGAVYHWPDPRSGWDQPPVWEDVVAPRDEPEDDGGDEELWRETAGAYAWNLEPTTAEADADGPGETDPPADDGDDVGAAPAAEPEAPFRTAAATAHVNAPAPRGKESPRGKGSSRGKAATGGPTAPRAQAAPRSKAVPRGRDASQTTTAAATAASVPSVTSLTGPPQGRARSRRRLLIGLIAAGAVLVLAALLAIGIAVGSATGPSDDAAAPVTTDAATTEPAPEPSAAPTAEIPAVGPLPAGTWAWSALLGGECLQPFDSVWAEEFTVVDCATAHSGEMVDTGTLTDATFPGQEALAASVASLCQATGVVDVTGAGAYGDVQVSGSFPVTQEQWDAGERSYYCFVDRAGGGELLGSLDGMPSA
ncbi:hypothetical protein SAMN06295885_3408 [Rathayibacter oskolensis]|uniref:Septum formation n=1 Tax=Rathayibacter oskolensis TaxID=1891671 RepID=A0A1X7PGB2_9MICO|nr:septum formation family protein [Rathayibacter oskolensis]SMH49768.1 hypothetical protein SAMN06295885_3408 [Rathayibacter oskolensis]